MSYPSSSSFVASAYQQGKHFLYAAKDLVMTSKQSKIGNKGALRTTTSTTKIITVASVLALPVVAIIAHQIGTSLIDNNAIAGNKLNLDSINAVVDNKFILGGVTVAAAIFLWQFKNELNDIEKELLQVRNELVKVEKKLLKAKSTLIKSENMLVESRKELIPLIATLQ